MNMVGTNPDINPPVFMMYDTVWEYSDESG